MNKLIAHGVLLAGSLVLPWLLPFSVGAAGIAWAPPVTIAGDTDVSTSGSLLYAYDVSNAGTIVNTVPFAPGNSATALGGDITISGFGSSSPNGFTVTNTPTAWSGLSTAYKTVLEGAVYGGAAVGTVTLNHLTSGHSYQVQVWVDDPRNLAARSETNSSTGGNSVVLVYDATGVVGGVGQYSIGTFTAGGTTQAFTVQASTISPSAQLNAIQVRDQTAAASGVWNTGTSGALWGTAGNWGGNVIATGTGSTADFSQTNITANTTVNLDTSWSLGNLIFGNAASTGNWILANNGVSGDALMLQGTSPTITVTNIASISAVISGYGGLTKAGPGTLVLSNANTYFGGTTVSNGILQLGMANAVPGLGGGSAGDVTVSSNAVLDLNGFNESLNGLNGAGTVDTVAGGSPMLTIGANGDGGTFSGIIKNSAGTLTLIKAGGGTETLSGTNNWSGPTVVTGGTLALLGNLTNLTSGYLVSTNNANSGNLDLGSGTQTVPTTALVASGQTVQVGNTTSGNYGYSTISVTGANGLPTIVTNNGSLWCGRDSGFAINANASWVQNGPMTIEEQGGYVANYTIAAGGSFTYAGTTPINATVGGAAEDNMSIAGLFTTGQPFDFNDSGTSGSGYPALTISAGGTLALSANIPQLIVLSGTGTLGQFLLGSNATLNTAGYNSALSLGLGNASGQTGSLVVTGGGTLTLAATNTYSGGTTVSNGTLALLGGGSVAASSTLTVLAGATLNVSAVAGVWQVASGQTLAGNGTVTGAVTVAAGGTLQPGLGGLDTSTLLFNNTLTLGGTTLLALNRTNAQNASQVAGVTALVCGGTLAITNAGPAPQAGDVFTLFRATNYSGSFASVNLTTLAAGLVWDTSQLLTNGSILVATGVANAVISWGAPVTIAGDTDVATNGGLLYAYDDADAATTVNGVAFAAGNSQSAWGANVGLSGNYSWSTTTFGSGAGSPWSGLSSAYQTLLEGGAYTSLNGTQTVTLENLVPGHPYLVQVWVNDSRSLASNRTETVSSSGGNTVTLDYNSTGASGGVGQYAIGTFTATAVTEEFTLAGILPVGGNSAQLNALQVRDLSAPNGTSLSTITLNPAVTYQQMYGIGGNFCQGDQNTLINSGLTNQVFSAQGLNLSFIRLGNTYDLTEPIFTNMAAGNNAVINAFRAMQPHGRITMTAWSPPETLKSTGSAFQGTLVKVGGQYDYADYANWWVSSLQYYQSNSSLPDYISIQNEPDWYPTAATNVGYEAGCELDYAEGTHAGYPQALAAVISAFQANGFGGVKLIGPDTSGIGSNIVPDYINSITNYLNTTTNPFAAVAHHLYGANAATTGVGALSTLESQYPYTAIPKFMTELNPGDSLGTNEPDWMGLAVTMNNVFTYEDASTYLIWSIMWGLINPDNGEPASDNYYVLGHYSKFIRPGDWRAQVTCSDPNVIASLYRQTNSNPQISDQLILVMINTSSNYSYPVIQTSAYWAANALQRSWQVYTTANDGSSQYRLTLTASAADASLTNNESLTLAPYSITTAIMNTGIASNLPPRFIYPATDYYLNTGQTLLVTNSASDPNQPPEALTFTVPTAPSGATINATNGILSWRPLIAQAHSVNPFAVVVSNNGTPSMSATQNFTVTVRPVTVPVVSGIAFSNSQFQMQVSGAAGPDYTLQSSTNLVTWVSLYTTNPAALPFGWTDTNSANAAQQFYRVLLGP